MVFTFPLLHRLQRWTVFGKFVLAVLFSVKLTSRQLQIYNTPPLPPDNPFVRNGTATISNNGNSSNGNNNSNNSNNNNDINNGRHPTIRHPPQISPHELAQELLDARMQAYISLGNYMRNSDSKETTFLLSQGGRVPVVVA